MCEAGEACLPVYVTDPTFCMLADPIDDNSDQLYCSCNYYGDYSNGAELLFCVPEA